MNYGCLPSKIDLRDYKVCAARAINIEYPAEFKLETPRVKNQLEINSCVAHATSSILEYYTKNKVKLSTNFIYGIQKYYTGHDGQGMYLIDACKIAKEFGDMLEEDCPGNNEVPYSYTIAENAYKNIEKRDRAYNFRITSFYSCKNTDDIKYALMNYGPILTCLKWYDEFEIVSPEGLIEFNENSNYGYHAVMIYGWNEKGWLIQNSWGEDFANKGDFILAFKDNSKIAEARVLIDFENPDEVALIKPKTNIFTNIIYKIVNFLLNLIK